MKSFWEGFRKESAEKAEIARVALLDTVNSTILIGKRKDNERWTMTSGHLEKGETPEEAAVREVQEEAGIKIRPDQLRTIGSHTGKKKDGTPVTVHGFYVPFAGQTPRAVTGKDPDDEMSQWRWESLSKGLPEDISSRLHIPLKKDKVMQFALSRMASQPMEKAAIARVMRLMTPDDLSLVHQIRQKLLTEGPQQYAQNYDAIQTYKEKRKRSKTTQGATRS